MTGYSLTQTWNGNMEVISHWRGCGCPDCTTHSADYQAGYRQAKAWVNKRLESEYTDTEWYWEPILIEAYLAGSAQTQADYTKG